MRYFIAVLAGSCLICSTAVAAEYNLPTKGEKKKYSALWHAVKKKDARAPGRNIRKYGIKSKRGKVRAASARELALSIRRLRILRLPQLSPMPPRIPTGGPMTGRVAPGSHLARIAKCESGGDPHNKKNPVYRGKYQFSYSTWASVGGSGDPADASEAEQDMRAAMLYARSGPGQWPVCQHR